MFGVCSFQETVPKKNKMSTNIPLQRDSIFKKWIQLQIRLIVFFIFFMVLFYYLRLTYRHSWTSSYTFIFINGSKSPEITYPDEEMRTSQAGDETPLISLPLKYAKNIRAIRSRHFSHRDLVVNLPGTEQIEINFRHYSGYLKASKETYLHYWFFESQQNPSEDPLVLWLNGGPGCSSIMGALDENGPFKLNTDRFSNQLELNPFSWNKRANLLFLESPAGVGFSFNLPQNYATNDNETANNNFLALKSFFREFPRFLKNDFYVAGESYAGVYIPTLAVLLVDSEFPKQFKGFAIGNGLLDSELNTKSMPLYFYTHGLIDDQKFNLFVMECCSSNETYEQCDIKKSSLSSRRCVEAFDNAINVNFTGLNPYNIHAECKSGFEQTDCLDSGPLEWYLNQESVKQAMHVPSGFKWRECNRIVNSKYTSEMFFGGNVRHQIEYILQHQRDIKILIYSGDLDSVCNFLGNEWFVKSLHQKLAIDHKHWHYSSGTKVGGYIKQYENHLSFAVVRGAGHMVPKDQPEASQSLFFSFLFDSI